MRKDAADFLKEALRPPPAARAALIDCLLESLDTEVDDDAEEAWRREIYRRLEEIDSGAVELVPWADAQRRLLARFHR